MISLANISKQKGQSLLWVLGFLATMAVAFAGVYSVGQTTSEKQKIVNAVDAAAYTGAMVQARALNLAAYANRAEIANEVLVAQMVSMQSWVDYMKTSASNFETVSNLASFIPGVGIVFQAISKMLQVMEKVLDIAAKGFTTVIPFTIVTVETYYGIMNAELTQVFGDTGAVSMAFAAQAAAESVLAANTSNQGGKTDTAPVAIHKPELMIKNGLAWKNAFIKYKKNESAGSASDGRRNAADIISISRDDFSKGRVGPDSDTALGVVLQYFWGSGSVGLCPLGKLGARREGSTQLLSSYDRWEAQDTSEYYIAKGIKCKKNTVPYGWGRSTAAGDKNKGDIKQDINSKAGNDSHAYSDEYIKTNGNWTGVKDLWDVKRDKDDYPDAAFNPGAETLTFAIAAAKVKANIKNNESLNFMNKTSTSPLGSADAKANYQNDQIAAKSEAKIFFSRPAKNSQDFTGTSLFRNDNHKEIASLYKPYWQVRLVNTSVASNVIINKLFAFYTQ